MATREQDPQVRLLVGSLFTSAPPKDGRAESEPQYLRQSRPRRRRLLCFVEQPLGCEPAGRLRQTCTCQQLRIARAAESGTPGRLSVRCTAGSGDEAKSTTLYYLLRSFLHNPLGAHHRERVRKSIPKAASDRSESQAVVDVSAQRCAALRRAKNRIDPQLLAGGATSFPLQKANGGDPQHRLSARHSGVSPSVAARAGGRRSARHL